MNKIDKKQLPQLIALIVLSVGVFGFFIFRMLAPTPAAAQSPAVAKSTAGTDAVKTAVVAAVAAVLVPAPAPTAAMRDPFLPGVADQTALDAYQKTLAVAAAAAAPHRLAAYVSSGRRFGRQAASLTAMPVPQVAPLPTLDAFSSPSVNTAQPMPVVAPPAAPVTWSVTGVLGGDGGVAILRDGESRRIVKQGDLLLGGLRVAHIARGSVTLERDGQKYRLPLGGSKDAPKTNDSAATAPKPTDAPLTAPGAVPAAPEAPATPITP